ncbi:hypothetical protein D3C83_169130 [compost metagenome]
MLGSGLVADAEVELPLERLEAEICELAGHLVAGECRWMVLLSPLDPRIEAQGQGRH